MKNVVKRALCVTLVFLFLFSTVTFADLSISSYGACVMDFTTGEVLYQYQPNRPLVPGSMTKVMTLYCVYEALKNGEISLDTLVPITSTVHFVSMNPTYQNVPLLIGGAYTVDEMMNIVITYSPCNAAAALGELVGGGSQAAFVDRMNQTARRMGIDAFYYDCYGIADNQVTPLAMATLARNIISEYPDVINRSSHRSVSFHGGVYGTTNRFFDSYYYEGADGLKTGSSSAAGYCFCGTAVRDGRRMIAVTMHSASNGQAFSDATALMDFGFAEAKRRYDSILYTDERTFLDGNEIPTFRCAGYGNHLLIAAEDLRDYGFDLSYDEANRLLTVTRMLTKKPTPIPMESYRNKNGQKKFPLYHPSDLRVILREGTEEYPITPVYDAGGYACIELNAFQNIYGFSWDFAENCARIDTSKNIHSPSAWAKDAVITAISDGLVPTQLQDLYQKPITRSDALLLFSRLVQKCSGGSLYELAQKKGLSVDTTVFSDTSDKEISAAKALSLITGEGEHYFGGDLPMTRGQGGVILGRIASLLGASNDPTPLAFTDIYSDQVRNGLGFVLKQGIMHGVSASCFDPDASMTREQAISICQRAALILQK